MSDYIENLINEKMDYRSGFCSLFIHLKVSHPNILEGIFNGELNEPMKKDVEIAMKIAKLKL